MKQTNFRTALRNSTRPEHDHLDEIVSTLNIAEPEGFCHFVHLHLISFCAMSDAVEIGSYAHAHLRQMTDCLARDLETLGGKADTNLKPLDNKHDPLAVDYIVAGSRLGSQVLKKRWLESQDPIVRRADAYFSLETEKTYWPSTCQALTRIPTNSIRAKKIERDTKSLFQLFATALQSMESRKAAII